MAYGHRVASANANALASGSGQWPSYAVAVAVALEPRAKQAMSPSGEGPLIYTGEAMSRATKEKRASSTSGGRQAWPEEKASRGGGLWLRAD